MNNKSILLYNMGSSFEPDYNIFVKLPEKFWDERTQNFVKQKIFSGVNPVKYSQVLGRDKYYYELWVDYENPIESNVCWVTYRAYQTNQTTKRVRKYKVTEYIR
jgi:hypothetical protein